MSEELAPRLDPKAIEPARYKAWQDGGYFHVPASRVLEDGADPYVIVIPPPNVTAVLHMGHGLNTTIQDVLIRWQRMRGRAALWVPGTDHAGIATQNVVERRLAAEGCHRDDLGRDKFVEAVWRFVGETGGVILDQLKAIGASCDWDRTRFTLDEDLSRAVRETFVHLYEKGLVYRGEYIINWCPRCLTALSNEEAEGHESQGKLWHLRYPLAESAFGAAEAAAKAGADALGQLEDGTWYLTVSTTRPETMLGDTGVAVSPKDERYRALVGAEARLPLTGRTIPIVADTHVDAAFGSGMVKVTPAHDPNDFDIAGRTGLEVINVMTPGAHMNDNVPEAFQGLERFAARKAVLKALDEFGLLSGESDHTHSVPHCYRCDTVVEPRLSLQWFVKMGPLAEPALKASRDGTITFTPPHWQKVYEHWMETIRDWCISRQLWWGHRIPVWYCEQGHETVGREDPTECGECGSTVLEQDPDVLDTWFSSQLWPFSVFGWPEKTPDVDAFYPGHSMVTAPEILFFWVARMIMSALEFTDEVPFHTVYLHGLIHDEHGKKMSKTKGNVIDPLIVMDELGTDALRFTLLVGSTPGKDTNLSLKKVESNRNFANKVWNASRFILSMIDTVEADDKPDTVEWTLADSWIWARLQDLIRRVERLFTSFQYGEAGRQIYDFFWGDFADWYLEIAKLQMRDEKLRYVTARTLARVLDNSLRLLHPFSPFVTEELWGHLRDTIKESPLSDIADDWSEVLITASWPEERKLEGWEDAKVADFELIQDVVGSIRNLRAEKGVEPGKRIAATFVGGEKTSLLREQAQVLAALARVDEEKMSVVESIIEKPEGSVALVVGQIEIYIPLEGLVDLAQERERLASELKEAESHITRLEKMLNSPFAKKAPPAVVDKEREKLAVYKEAAEKIKAQL